MKINTEKLATGILILLLSIACLVGGFCVGVTFNIGQLTHSVVSATQEGAVWSGLWTSLLFLTPVAASVWICDASILRHPKKLAPVLWLWGFHMVLLLTGPLFVFFQLLYEARHPEQFL